MAARTGPLLDQILRDAAASAEARIGAARAEAERVTSAASEHAGRRRRAAIADRERELTGAFEATRAETSQRVGRETLGARAAALDRIFAAAAAQLPSLTSHPRLGDVLGAALMDALSYLPDGPATVRCPSVVADAVRSGLAAAGRAGTTVRADDTVALGAIVESADGAVAVDVTFATRLVRARPRLAIAIAQTLAGTSA